MRVGFKKYKNESTEIDVYYGGLYFEVAINNKVIRKFDNEEKFNEYINHNNYIELKV